ncbi:MAG: hypothetical protein P8018_12865 [Acidobacteriota bacterium]
MKKTVRPGVIFIWILFAAGIILFLIPQISPVINPAKWDEYIVTFDAQRLLYGQVPYRDFFNFIPPGSFYLLASIFVLFGKGSLAVSRLISLVTVVGGSAFFASALHRSGWGRSRAFLLAAVYPVCLYPFWAVVSHHWFAVLFAMIFLWAAAGRKEDGGWGVPLLLGLAAGASLLFLQTVGLYLAVAALLVVLLWGTGKPRVRDLAALSFGWLLPILAGVLPLVFLGAGPKMFHDLVVWPSHNYSKPGSDNARLPLSGLGARLDAIWHPGPGHPPWQWVPFAAAGTLLYLAILAGAGLVLFLAARTLYRMIKTRTSAPGLETAACLLTFLSAGLYLKGRPDWLHLIYLLAFLGPLWLVALGRGASARGRRWTLALALLLLVCGGLYQDRRAWFHFPALREITDPDYPVRNSSVNRFLRSHLHPGQSVAAFPEGGEVYLYNGYPACGYTFFMPPSADYNSEKDNQTVAGQLEASRPRWIVMTDSLAPDYLDPASPVGRLIRKHYVRSRVIGHAVFFVRKDRW